MRTVLYARVSTADQTLAHQRTMAEQAGFEIDEVVADEGVSGIATNLADREQGRRLFDMLRKGDVLVVRWIDRLGRSYSDVCDVIREFIRRGVIVRTVIGNMTFDGATRDPMQMAVRDALIGFLAATGQAQAEATKAAQAAGIAHVKANAPETYLGRAPSFTAQHVTAVRDMLSAGQGPSTIAKATGLTRQTIHRLRDDPTWAEALLAKWDGRRCVERL
jgi:putative DNA-invertase from lambdoid prophage Rac